MKRSMTRLTLALATLVLVVYRWATRARVPDDYDSVGFVRAVEHFDLAQFQPHFPGYPVYVALTRVLHACGVEALAATTLVSALASAATAVALWRIVAARVDARAGFVAFALWTVALSPALTGGAALSDATATALAAWSFAALTWPGRRAAFVAGVLLALTLGARASYWPLALSLAFVVRHARRPSLAALAGAVVGTLAWAVPFVGVVGASALWQLGRTHVTGHFTVWGGSVITRPDVLARAGAWTRDLVYDGVWPHPLALVVALAAVVMAAPRPLRPSRATVVVALAVAAPYALWTLFGQNILEQPRHLLPLVAALVVALALATHARWPAAIALVVASACASTPLAISRARLASASARAGTFIATQDLHALVYGMRATRLIAYAAPTLVVHPRQSFVEVEGDLERLDVLPHDVYVTSEVTGTPLDGRPLVAVATFCRDARIDRQLPCVTVSRYTVRPWQ